MKELRKKLETGKTTLSILQSNLKGATDIRAKLKVSTTDHLEARALFQRASEITQEKLAIHLSDLVSLALKTVFKNPYKFKVEFVSKRGGTECNLFYTDDKGNEYSPLNSCGYGAADVASLALRVAYHSLGDTRPVLVFDEPLRHLSTDLMGKASELIESLSKELGLQFIIVTHSEELANSANKTFTVNQIKGISKIMTTKH